MKNEGKPSISDVDYGVAVPRNDPGIDEARVAAKNTLAQFIELIMAPGAANEYQAVQVQRSGAGFDEYIWMPVQSFQNGSFVAAKAAQQTAAHTPPDENIALIRPDEVSDWMIVKNGKLNGGYSIRVMRAKMTPEQQVKFDNLIWFEMS